MDKAAFFLMEKDKMSTTSECVNEFIQLDLNQIKKSNIENILFVGGD